MSADDPSQPDAEPAPPDQPEPASDVEPSEPDVPPPPPVGEGFDDIVDDGEFRAEAHAWAWAELRTGRDGEDVVADLVARGWDDDEAAGLVEAARKDPGPSEAASIMAPRYRPRGGIIGAIVNGIVALASAVLGLGDTAEDEARRADRVARGACPNCGFDLQGAAGPCPNCGAKPR